MTSKYYALQVGWAKEYGIWLKIVSVFAYSLELL